MDYTVVIVDDDEMCLYLHKLVIQRADFHCSPLTFDSAAKALRFLKDGRADRRRVILFLDLNMPGMSGWEFLEIIHEADYANEVYVVVITSSVDSRDRQRAASFRRVIDFVEKPFTAAVLSMLRRSNPWLSNAGSHSDVHGSVVKPI